MQGERSAAMMLVPTVLLLLVASSPCVAALWPVDCRRADGSQYVVQKCYCPSVDTDSETCYVNTPWCLKTRQSKIKLRHWHFNENFTDTERQDADRWLEYRYSAPGPSTRYLSATTSFNCHAYALNERGDVWNLDQTVTLNDDFNQMGGCGYTPAEEDIIRHNGNHSSVIDSVGPTKVMSKWGAYGKYKTGPNIFGGIESYWREKTP